MDAIDILGELLGRKTRQKGKGGSVLKDIFGRGSQKQSPPTRERTRTSATNRPIDIQREARELEELLNVANDRTQNRRSGRRPSPPPPQSKTPPQKSDSSRSQHRQPKHTEDDRAVILIRAMVNAAKADGKLDRNEQSEILKQAGDMSPENVAFLCEEFARPLDVVQFARSVPIGMEQQVYTLSLVAIDLDTGSEANYLVELAENLRLPLEIREQIHQRLGAPSIY